MNFRQIDKSPKTFVLVFKTGDELAKGLSTFAEEQKLSAASRFSRSRQRRLHFPGTCFHIACHPPCGPRLRPELNRSGQLFENHQMGLFGNPVPHAVLRGRHQLDEVLRHY